MKYVLDYNTFILLEKDLFQDGIRQEQVPKTKDHIIKTLLSLLGITEGDISFVGSAGKLSDSNTISHNINLVIDSDKISESIIDDTDKLSLIYQQISSLGYNCKTEDENKLIIEWPIEGNENENKIDLIIEISDNFKWVCFSRYCPNMNTGESKYNGKYRRALLSAITESIDKKVEAYKDDRDSVESYSKFIFDLSEGIYRIHKHFTGNDSGTSTATEINERKKLVTNDPKEFVTMLFKSKVSPDDIMTFEQLKDGIFDVDFKFPEKIEQIKSRFKKKCFELNISPIQL